MTTKIEKFYVVTFPTKHSEGLIDILFESDIKRMRLQYLGGLQSDEIEGIYLDETEAKMVANKLLQKKGAHNV